MPNNYDNDEYDDEPIVRFLSIDEKAVQDFKAQRWEHLRALGYTVDNGILLDNFGDVVACQFDESADA